MTKLTEPLRQSPKGYPQSPEDRVASIDKETEQLLDQIVLSRSKGERNASAIDKLGKLSQEKIILKRPVELRASN